MGDHHSAATLPKGHHPPSSQRQRHAREMGRQAASRRREIMLALLLAFCITGLLTLHYVHSHGGAVSTINKMLTLERQAFTSFSSLQIMLGWARKQPPLPVLYLWPAHGCGLLLQQRSKTAPQPRNMLERQSSAVLTLVDNSSVMRWSDNTAADEDSELHFATCTFTGLLSETAMGHDWMQRVCDLQPTPQTLAQQFPCLYLKESMQGVPTFLRGSATVKCDGKGSVITVCRMEPDSDWQADSEMGWDLFPGGVPDAGVLGTHGITLHTLLG